MLDKYVINGYELDAEDFDEDPTEIIDEQGEGDEIDDEIAEDAAPLDNATLSFPWRLPYCSYIVLLFLLQLIYTFLNNKS